MGDRMNIGDLVSILVENNRREYGILVGENEVFIGNRVVTLRSRKPVAEFSASRQWRKKGLTIAYKRYTVKQAKIEEATKNFKICDIGFDGHNYVFYIGDVECRYSGEALGKYHFYLMIRRYPDIILNDSTTMSALDSKGYYAEFATQLIKDSSLGIRSELSLDALRNRVFISSTSRNYKIVFKDSLYGHSVNFIMSRNRLKIEEIVLQNGFSLRDIDIYKGNVKIFNLSPMTGMRRTDIEVKLL